MMKEFLSNIIAITALLTLVLVISVFCLPDQYICNSMLGVERDKLDRLRRLDGPRIVFVGGSNVGTGFDSRIVEAELRRPVVNMGLHAGLGLIYQMQSIENLIHKGDLIVIIPEYEQFTKNCFGDEELLAMVTAIVPEHCRLISMWQWLKLCSHVPRYGARKLIRFWTLWEPPRRYVGYDMYGDEIGGRSSMVRLPFLSVTDLMGPELYTGEVISYLNRFIEACQSKGGRVVLLPPVHEYTSFQNERGFIKEIARQLVLNNTPFLVDPESFVFPDDNFADTRYHLNGKGVVRRMKYISSILGNVL